MTVINVDVPGASLWVETRGSGRPVLFVHSAIADARMWDPQWHALAGTAHLVRYDARGFGRSRSDASAYSEVADLLGVMDGLSLERATLVGSSRGGRVALDAAIAAPDRVEGLVWVCGGISGFDPGEPSPALAQRFDAISKLAEARDWAAVADAQVALWVDGPAGPVGRAPAHVRELVRLMCLENLSRELPDAERLAPAVEAIDRLEEIRIPVLAIGGDLDGPATAAMTQELGRRVPDVVEIHRPAVAHFPSLEQPSWFGDMLTRFLDRA